MEQEKKFYVYKWYNKDTGEVFYVGKGCRGRSGQVTRRNEIFKKYYNTHDCDHEIIEYFDDEAPALEKEHELILYYKSINQAIANLDDGGKGGLSFIWTQEMRDYKSQYNPMKNEKQRQRMSENNPMKNSELAQKVGLKHRRAVIINNKIYTYADEAAQAIGVHPATIREWCKKGYTPQGDICRFEDELNNSFPPYKPYTHSQNIEVIVDGIIYPNIKTAAKVNNLSYTNFATALKKNHKTYKGHTCSYANQQPSQENNQ